MLVQGISCHYRLASDAGQYFFDILKSSVKIKEVVHPARFERATLGFGGRYSIQLSYECIVIRQFALSSITVHESKDLNWIFQSYFISFAFALTISSNKGIINLVLVTNATALNTFSSFWPS